MEQGAIGMSTDDTTGRVLVQPAEPEERTARAFFLAPPPSAEAEEDRTAVDRARSLTLVGHDTAPAVLTSDMVEELRRRLREAEAREASGVRIRPTPEDGTQRDALIASAPRSEAPWAEPPEVAYGIASAERSEPAAWMMEALDPLADLEIEVEEPRTLEELEEVVSPLPELEVALAPKSESNFYAGFDDEHPDGVFVATHAWLPVGTPVYLSVRLPAGYGFRTPALVAWIRPPEVGAPPGMGLEMCGLDHRMRRIIRAFVRYRRPIFYPS